MPDELPDEPSARDGSAPATPDEVDDALPQPPEGGSATAAEQAVTAPSSSDEQPVPDDERVPKERSVPDDERVPDEEPVPDEELESDEPPVPDEDTLVRVATPGAVRRAPKFGAFIGYGAVLGFVVGVALAIALDRGDLVAAGEGGGVLPFLGGSNGARLMTGVALAGIGALVGALLALWADARSRRHAR